MTLRSEPKPDCTYCRGVGIISVSKDPDLEADCVCTDLPTRVCLSRARGWRKPENTVVVARPSRFGNPFRIGHDVLWVLEGGNPVTVPVPDAVTAVQMFRRWMNRPGKPSPYMGIEEPPAIDELAGKNLACWCPLDQPCHADVLLELANGRPS